MFGTNRLALLVAGMFVAFVGWSAPARGGSQVHVNFETIPGGVPSDGLIISNQFPNAVFSLEGGGAPQLAGVGGVGTAFAGPPANTTGDTPLIAGSLGQFFLTDDGIVSTPKVVVITLLNPVAHAGGEILDVDGGEVWHAEARDKNGTLLETRTISAGDPDTGDGVATPFFFHHQVNDIASVRFTYSGVNQQTGFGFDNFVAATVPLPPAVWSGLALLGATMTMIVLQNRHGGGRFGRR